MSLVFSKSAGYTTPSNFTVSPSAPTPFWNTLAGATTASARGIYSLYAISGTSVKVIQLSQGPSYPTAPNFTSGGTQTNNQYSQALTGSITLLTGTYVANCSSWATTDGTSQAWKAFDGDTTTWWENNYYVQSGYDATGAYTGSYSTTVSGSTVSGEWLQLQFPIQVALRSYSMYARSGWTSRMPKNFTVAGSNDGLTWTTVDTQSGITSWTGQTPISFTPSVQTTPWTYFRLIGQALQSGPNDINIGQWTLSVTPYSDFYADTKGNLTTGINGTGQSVTAWLAGTTGYITTWYDQSGGANNAIQTNVSLQPFLTLAANNYINFNVGTVANASFTFTNQIFPLGNSPFTTITRLGPNPQNATVGSNFWHFGLASSGQCTGLQFRGDYVPGRYQEYFYNGFDMTATSGTYAANTVVSTASTGSAQTMWQPGNLVIGTQTYSGLNVTAGPQFIGSGAANTSNTGIQMRDLYIFSSVLSQTDRNLLETGYITTAAVVPTVFTKTRGVLASLTPAAQAAAVSAYSLRALYFVGAKVAQVKRNSDSALQDFYADSFGNLTTASGGGTTIASWLGGSTGNIYTWYDQTNSGYNLTQPTAANQPTINIAPVPATITCTAAGLWVYNTSYNFNFGSPGTYTLRMVVTNTAGGIVVFKGDTSGVNTWTGNLKKWWFGDSTTGESTVNRGLYPESVGFAESWTYAANPITTAKTSVTYVASSTTSTAIYVNGSSVTLGLNNRTLASDPSTGLYIGNGGAGGTTTCPFIGDIAEIIMFSKPLGQSDLTILG